MAVVSQSLSPSPSPAAAPSSQAVNGNTTKSRSKQQRTKQSKGKGKAKLSPASEQRAAAVVRSAQSAVQYARRVPDASSSPAVLRSPYASSSSPSRHHQQSRSRAEDSTEWPALNQPLRLDPPAAYRCPPRKSLSLQPKAVSSPSPNTVSPTSARRVPAKVANASRMKSERELVEDYRVKAQACRRCNKVEAEAVAYLCKGIVHENLGEYKRAIASYEQFQAIAEELGRAEDMALAFNFLGVTHYLLGETSAAHYEHSLFYHEHHVKASPDGASKFIAFTNLGLVHAALGNLDKARDNHKLALRWAVTINSNAGQSLALGHLGLLGQQSEDLETARACMEHSLELSTEISSDTNRCEALNQLGHIAQRQHALADAVGYFEQALEVARESNDQALINKSKVNLGVALGSLKFAQAMKGLASQLSGGEANTTTQ